MTEPLTAVELAMLDLERCPWRDPLAKEQAIRDRFGWSPTLYHHALNRLIDEPAAWAADPLTVKRLRRRRAERRAWTAADVSA
ncbi:MAG: DUF3263 domain-containing protein [Propionibacteriaceae bacterium]|jgi:hypothetical protein|nr:DUF3263 domain-containing protein [Propionibacteriaceae bacterium]